MKDNVYVFYSISSLIFLILGFMVAQIREYWKKQKKNYENEVDYYILSDEVGEIKVEISSIQKDLESMKTNIAVNEQIIEDMNKKISITEKTLQTITTTIVQKMDNIFTKMDDRLHEIKDNVQEVDKKIDKHIAYHRGKETTEIINIKKDINKKI